ncbi:hypothetical protein EHS25_002080 [Saitozyma podzolica]|uniref:Uncharacterized protein n=1 Tax=Saitozyma podzolica TaxID=1890683 RepID=A0A427YEL8_9TREE|nr:hypothetical protein EHS25_002080 [Saitozyma podzolica]
MPPTTAQNRSARLAVQLARSRRHSASDANVESLPSGEDTVDSSDSGSDADSDKDRADGAGYSNKWSTNIVNTLSDSDGSQDDQSDSDRSGDDLPSYSQVVGSVLEVPTGLCWEGAISPLALDTTSSGIETMTRSLIFLHTDFAFRSETPDGERKCINIWPMSVDSAPSEYRPLLICQQARAVAVFTAPHEDRAAAHLCGALNSLQRYIRAARAGRDRCIPHCVRDMIECLNAGYGRADGYSHVKADMIAVEDFAAVWNPEWDEALDPELIRLLQKVCVTRTKAISEYYLSLEGIKSPVSIVSRSEWRRRADPNEHDDGMGHTLSVSWESAGGWDDEEGDVLVSEPGDPFTVVRFKQEPINGADMGFIDLR